MAKDKKKFNLFKKKDKDLKEDVNLESSEAEKSSEDFSSSDAENTNEKTVASDSLDANETKKDDTDKKDESLENEENPESSKTDNSLKNDEDSKSSTADETNGILENDKNLESEKLDAEDVSNPTSNENVEGATSETANQSESVNEDATDKSTNESSVEENVNESWEESSIEEPTDETVNESTEETANDIIDESTDKTVNKSDKEASTEEVQNESVEESQPEENEEKVDPAVIEQQEKEEAERILKEQEEERQRKEKEKEEQRKREEEWEKEKARLALERKLKSEKILQDAIDCAAVLTKLIEEGAPSEQLLEEIQKAEGFLEKLQMEIDSPWVEEFKPVTAHEKSEEAEADVLIAKAKAIIAETEKLKEEMQSVVPDDLEEDYYLSDEEQNEDVGFKIHKPKDDLEGQEVLEEELTADEIERAYDVGVGLEFDDYDREILDPVFENYLRMSTNSLKYRYSRLKNDIMSYSQITHSFDGMFENFRINRNLILRLSVSNDKLYLYCALPLGSLDKKVYPHKKAVGAHGKVTPTVLTIKDEKTTLNAIEVIAVVMAKNNIMHKKHFVPTAYAERYPLNPNAVILGYEHIPPIEGQYDDEFEYDPITGEIVDGIVKAKVKRTVDPKKLTGKEKLEDMRQVAKTIKASVAMTEPIVYFYDAAIDASNNVQYVNIQQVLNDKFFGKILPQSYFAVAEGSDRIETLNFLALEHAVKLANASKNLRFVLALSVRLLLREKVFERLLRNAKTENHNLILAFDCSLLESIGDIGLNAITKLRNECSSMIMIDNAENAGMKVLTEYDYEYLRFDARYYEGDSPRQQAHLHLLAEYCKTQNIRSTSINVLNMKEAQKLIKLGVEIIQGYAVSEPKRNLNQAVRNIQKIPPVR